MWIDMRVALGHSRRDKVESEATEISKDKATLAIRVTPVNI